MSPPNATMSTGTNIVDIQKDLALTSVLYSLLMINPNCDIVSIGLLGC